MKHLLTGHLNAAACASAESVDLRATLLASGGRDASSLPLAAQAALAAVLFRRTRQLSTPPRYLCGGGGGKYRQPTYTTPHWGGGGKVGGGGGGHIQASHIHSRSV